MESKKDVTKIENKKVVTKTKIERVEHKTVHFYLISVFIVPQLNFCENVMEIRIIAKKGKSDFKKKDSTLGSIMTEAKETYFPLLELMMKELKNEQEQMRSEQ